MNLSEEALRSICSADRNGTPAFFTSKGSITRTELERAVFAVANGFASLGVAQGDRVLLRISNSVEFAVAFLGSIWAGIIPVLQNSQFGRREIEHIAALSRPAAVLYSSSPEDDEPTL